MIDVMMCMIVIYNNKRRGTLYVMNRLMAEQARIRYDVMIIMIMMIHV